MEKVEYGAVIGADSTLPWMLCENAASPNSVTHPATQILLKVLSG